jgi:predicted anti-sigma-YlaC factor YlaD
MECRDFRPQVEDFLAHSLQSDSQAAFEAHRAQCADCRAYLQDVLKLARMLRLDDPVRAPEGLWDKIEARLLKDLPAPTVAPIIKFMRFMSAAAAVALVTLGILVMRAEVTPANLDRIQTSEFTWISGDDDDDVVDPIADMLMSPKEK